MVLMGQLLTEIALVNYGLRAFVYFDTVAVMFLRYHKRMHLTNFIHLSLV